MFGEYIYIIDWKNDVVTGDFIDFYLYYRLEERRCYRGFYRLLFILQIGRTTLLPGILKTICNNKSMPLPLKLFEISDVMYCDKSKGMSGDHVQHL